MIERIPIDFYLPQTKVEVGDLKGVIIGVQHNCGVTIDAPPCLYLVSYFDDGNFKEMWFNAFQVKPVEPHALMGFHSPPAKSIE